jgi:UDP-N-acetylglucosamine 2-epimerase (non-hydrolysing)
LHIPDPTVNLGIAGGDRLEVIDRTDKAMEEVLKTIKPDIVLVYGDVNGAVGAARAAHRLGIRIAHIEAGLRSYDMTMPEEVNRLEIDRLADILFCSEQSGMDHLAEEKVLGRSYLVGNTMIDTLMGMKKVVASQYDDMHARLSEYEGRAVATIHRPSNVDDPRTLAHVISFLSDIAKVCPIVLPAHPRLQHALQQNAIVPGEGIVLAPPFSYLDFLHVVQSSTFILTDSGGIQEEAVLLGKRCFTLRRNTERPSTIASGSNTLIDPMLDSDRAIVFDFAAHLIDPVITIPEKWDGKTGERIAALLSVQPNSTID